MPKGSNAGAAYAFDCPNANCTGRELIADPLEAGDWFGTSVALAQRRGRCGRGR